MMTPGGKAQARSLECARFVGVVILSASFFLGPWCNHLCPPAFARAIKLPNPTQDVRVTDDGFSYQVERSGDRRDYRFDKLAYVQAEGSSACYARAGDKSQPEIDKSLSVQDARNSILSAITVAFDTDNDRGGRCLPLFWKHKEDASRFANAVNRMIWENSAEVRAQREQQFEQKVAAWRASGSKIDPPEEAQRDLVLAQQAYQEKNFQHMAEELLAAVEVYPMWPDQQRNLAIVLGELNRYSEAIQHMQMYLELVPASPDAQQIKQQIWIWQDKVQSAQQAAPTPTRKVPRR